MPDDHRTIRDAWLQAVIDRCQALIGQFTFEDIDDPCAVTMKALGELPALSNRSESLLLRAVLLDLGLRLVRHVHSRRSTPQPCGCMAENERPMMQFWNALDRAVLPGFSDWIRAFVDTCHRAHPPTIAEQAARFIRQRAPERLGDADVAAQYDCTVPSLRRAFFRRYGLSVHDYQRITRIVHMVPRMKPGIKIESIALEAGYRSKKDFYRVFKDVIGLTPARFRDLPSSQAVPLAAAAKSRLVPRPRRTG